MRKVSKKRAKLMREAKEWRANFVKYADCCDICGAMPHLVHEIARGIHRENALMAPYAILALCTLCHDREIHGREEWPIPKQLAALYRSRPDDYDLDRFNQLRGRVNITQGMVDDFLSDPS